MSSYNNLSLQIDNLTFPDWNNNFSDVLDAIELINTSNLDVIFFLDSLNATIISNHNFISNLIISSYDNLTVDVADLDSDLQQHDVDIKALINGLNASCTANFNSLTTLINDLEIKIDLILEQLNIVLDDINLVADTIDCLEGSTWSIEVTATDNFGVILDDSDINCNITTDLWGFDNLTFVVDSWDYTHICGFGSPTVNWSVSCDEI